MQSRTSSLNLTSKKEVKIEIPKWDTNCILLADKLVTCSIAPLTSYFVDFVAFARRTIDTRHSVILRLVQRAQMLKDTLCLSRLYRPNLIEQQYLMP